MSFNITLQNIINFCSTQADLLPLSGIGGITNEPALTFCNDAISELITTENDWKFNRVEMPMLVTCPQKQDYLFAGAVAFSLGSTSQGWAIDLASNSAIQVTGAASPPVATSVTITTLEPHRFAIGDTIYLSGVIMTTGTTSLYNSIFTDTGVGTSWSNGWVITSITTNSFSFTPTAGQNINDAGGAPGIFNVAFLQGESDMVQMTNTSSPQYAQQVKAYRQLPSVSRIQNPDKVALIADPGNGVIKLRFLYVPGGTTWGVKLIYQAQAPTKQSLGDNWAPFPDHYSGVYRQAVIVRMYRHLNSPQETVEYEKLQKAIAKALAADDTEQTDVSLQPDCLMDDGYNGGFNW